MLASAEFDYRKLFPEYFPEKIVVDADSAEAADPAAQYDYSEVSWKSPAESMDEYERLVTALQNSTSGVVKGDQLPANTWGVWQ